MDESILNSIRRMLGPTAEDEHFDAEIIPLINKEFWKLRDIGVGPDKTFSIEDSTSVWSDFMENIELFEAIKTFIYYGVKLIFDPPTQTSHLQAMKEDYKEYESRLHMACDKT
jgi:hypothetical protein